jgi:FMN phosphatase YigB (HAD superfamily)
MHYQNLTELDFASTCSKVFTTDVFDTLLLRTSKAERSRIAEGERRFSEQLARGGRTVSADLLLDTRLRAQRLAFRALNLGGRGEVRLIDVVSRQLRVLGLPESLVADRLRIELEVERESLVANEALAKYLRARRAEGSRVVAVSDTTLSGTQVLELIEHFHGDGLVDRAYSSADYGSTKRNGELFVAVANAENVALDDLIHIGDDVLADVRVPSAMGVHTHHVPRGAPRKYLRLADGATTEAQRRLRAIGTTFPRNRSPTPDRAAFAAEVFGPILVEFCVLLWLYTAQAEQTHSPVLLFCARGGIGIRAAFELVISKLELPLRTARKNLLVSRLVAARSALLARGESAVEELDREFRNGSFASVAAALGGRSYNLELEWQKAFSARDFLTLLNLPSGAEVLADIREQTLLFEHHLRSLSQGADRLILCDTGLYGSTQRLLADGFPQDHFETLQFARSNYKGHSEGHFQNVAGLLVEDNFYNPLNDRT